MLYEVGESNVEPYQIIDRKMPPNGKLMWAFFETEDIEEYFIGTRVIGDDTIEIGFGVIDKDGEHITNKGHMYRILSTVTQEIKKLITENSWIKFLQITPGKNGPTDKRRLNIYMQFINHEIKKWSQKIDVVMGQMEYNGLIYDVITLKILES